MKTPRILALVGGLSQGSLNKKLFQAFKETVGDQAEFILADISRLPFFSQDLENEPPDLVTSFKEQIRHADAILFITPEYNHSIPAVIKNAIDWGTRPYPQNLWEKIPVATMGASAGNTGTFGAQNHLRQILSYLNMYILNQPEFYMNGSKAFDQAGKLTDEKSRRHLEKLWTAFKAWIEQFKENEIKFQQPTVKSQGLEDSPWIQH